MSELIIISKDTEYSMVLGRNENHEVESLLAYHFVYDER